MDPELYHQAKCNAARKAGQTKIAGRLIKKTIEQVCKVAEIRLSLWQSWMVAAQNGHEASLSDSFRASAEWVNANPWATGGYEGSPEDFDVESRVAIVKRKLIQAAQAHSPDVAIKRRYGGLVFEAKVTLEGIEAAALAVLGENWQSDLPAPRQRRRRRRRSS